MEYIINHINNKKRQKTVALWVLGLLAFSLSGCLGGKGNSSSAPPPSGIGGGDSGNTSSGSGGSTTPSSIQVTSTSPSSGPFIGGTRIAVNGSGFQIGANIKIGGNFCTDVVLQSPSRLVCTTPAGTISTVSVSVINSDGKSSTLSNGFAYVDAVNPAPGHAVVTAGNIYTGTGMQVYATIGEPSTPMIQTGSGIEKMSGVQGTFYDPSP